MQRQMQPADDPIVIVIYILIIVVYVVANALLYFLMALAAWYLFKKFCKFISAILTPKKTLEEKLAEGILADKKWSTVLCGVCIFVGFSLIAVGNTGNSNIEIVGVKMTDTPAGIVFLVIGFLIFRQSHK